MSFLPFEISNELQAVIHTVRLHKMWKNGEAESELADKCREELVMCMRGLDHHTQLTLQMLSAEIESLYDTVSTEENWR